MKATKNKSRWKKGVSNADKAVIETNQLPHEWEKIKAFFEIFSPDSINDHLWQMLTLSLTHDGEWPDATGRGNLIFFYEQVVELLQNVRHVWERKKQNNCHL